MLSIFKNGSDKSLTLGSYTNGMIFSEAFLTSEYIEIGYYKPINALFIDLVSQNTANTITLQFWNGSSWVDISTQDKTFGLTKSGFISWERNIETQESHTLNTQKLFWYKLSVETNNITSLTLNGVDMLFADDSDLKESYPEINEHLPDGVTSFVSYHQSARNFILSYLRNKGKNVAKYGAYKMLDQFDLHNYEEVRQAAKYKALAMIFFNQSDRTDDKWYQKAKDFDSIYATTIDLNFLSLDLNDDGKIDASESQAVQFIKIQRL